MNWRIIDLHGRNINIWKFCWNIRLTIKLIVIGINGRWDEDQRDDDVMFYFEYLNGKKTENQWELTQGSEEKRKGGVTM